MPDILLNSILMRISRGSTCEIAMDDTHKAGTYALAGKHSGSNHPFIIVEHSP